MLQVLLCTGRRKAAVPKLKAAHLGSLSGGVPSPSHEGATAGKAATARLRSFLSLKLLKHVRVWGVLVLAAPLLFEPMRAGGFYSTAAYHPCGAPLTPMLLSWLAARTKGSWRLPLPGWRQRCLCSRSELNLASCS